MKTSKNEMYNEKKQNFKSKKIILESRETGRKFNGVVEFKEIRNFSEPFSITVEVLGEKVEISHIYPFEDFLAAKRTTKINGQKIILNLKTYDAKEVENYLKEYREADEKQEKEAAEWIENNIYN